MRLANFDNALAFFDVKISDVTFIKFNSELLGEPLVSRTARLLPAASFLRALVLPERIERRMGTHLPDAKILICKSAERLVRAGMASDIGMTALTFPNGAPVLAVIEMRR